MPNTTLRPGPRLFAALSLVLLVQLALLALTLGLVPGVRAGGGALGGVPGWLMLSAQMVALLTTAVGAYRVLLVARYRPSPDVEDAKLPTLTVVVPAYNEGRQVLSTLRSLAASDYPRDRLQLIAVDDGSADDTWMWIRRAERELGDRVLALRMPANGGKRRALELGFRRAKGEILITVDSDSEVLPDTLRRMVAPFLADPLCGAVAGNVRVLNRHAGALPKMLDAAFTTAFDFMRAGESETGAVMCTPGALSAYRADLLSKVLDEWLEQTFFGLPATIGEDRAMTNLLLREGATVRYQSDAIVLTQVPEGPRQLCRMFLRWGRSNVRESLVLARFVYRGRTADGGTRRGLQVLFTWSVFRMLLSAILFVPTLGAFALLRPEALLWLAALSLFSAVPMAAITLAARGGKVAFWALPWGLYSLVVTGWITTWALLTPHRGGWLTRGLQGSSATIVPFPRLPHPEDLAEETTRRSAHG